MTSRPTRTHSDAIWLGDSDGPAGHDLLTEALDQLYAAGPSRGELDSARSHLDDRLHRTAPATVCYEGVRQSPVGPVFVALTDEGVVAVDFADSERAFVQSMRARMGAVPVRSPEKAGEAARQLREYLSGKRTRFTLPLDLRWMSDFQREVLLAAAQIPCGQVTTYGQLARRIGRPGAARAVGQALGHNPIPIILPCHRVLASDGSLGGYSGRHGVRTKAHLLRLEGAHPLGL
jgi:methylated-DNA-[protein]-cysteine S-methyltransferase